MQFLLRCLMVAGCVSPWINFAAAKAEPITVRTVDGRQFSGELDSRSDKHALWLRYDEDDLSFAFALDWERIESVKFADSILEQREPLNGLSSEAPKGMLTEFEVLPDHRSASDCSPIAASMLRNRLASNQKITIVAVEAEAFLANLDRTVEPDGLRVLLAPVDFHGDVWPVRGDVTVRLLGQSMDLRTGEIRFRQLEQWSLPLDMAAYMDGLFSLSLRFHQVNPELDLQLSPLAQVHIRLGLPGQGNFETSTPLLLRDWDPYRDELQYHEGSRMFRGELTHNTRVHGPLWPARGYRPKPF